MVILKRKIVLINDWFRDDLETEILCKQENGAITLLENCRFYIEETGKGVDDSGKLSSTVIILWLFCELFCGSFVRQ